YSCLAGLQQSLYGTYETTPRYRSNSYELLDILTAVKERFDELFLDRYFRRTEDGCSVPTCQPPAPYPFACRGHRARAAARRRPLGGGGAHRVSGGACQGGRPAHKLRGLCLGKARRDCPSRATAATNACRRRGSSMRAIWLLRTVSRLGSSSAVIARHTSSLV